MALGEPMPLNTQAYPCNYSVPANGTVDGYPKLANCSCKDRTYFGPNLPKNQLYRREADHYIGDWCDNRRGHGDGLAPVVLRRRHDADVPGQVPEGPAVGVAVRSAPRASAVRVRAALPLGASSLVGRRVKKSSRKRTNRAENARAPGGGGAIHVQLYAEQTRNDGRRARGSVPAAIPLGPAIPSPIACLRPAAEIL